ncbi:pilus assembly protein TadG-related protein [Paraburkholderia sp. IW21]|uniref:pilus assembly protein TadG-related protein n=1 Tax=Paraburkholderia sp. IW21 TaxID=3242488 RepID=UPI00352112E5
MKRSARKGRARVASASGQALVPALIFLLVGSIGLYVAFNSFQMTSAKIKLQNTADAAAYSAAVLQARDYNFSAYTNRAMVANQVTAAQAVALKSWIDDLDSTYSHSDLDDSVKGIADHPDQWNTPKSRGKADIGPVRATLDSLLPTLAKGIGAINLALSNAQANYHAAVFVAVPDTADAVARQNQVDTHVTTGYFISPRNAVQLSSWQSYTRTVTPAGTLGYDHFADIVTNADTLDDFVKNRDSTRSVVPDYQQLDDSANKVCRSGGRIAITVSHDGGTQLRTDKKGWQSIDASTAHVNITCLYAFDAIAGSGGSANGNVQTFMSRPPFAAAEDWQGYGDYYNFGDHTSPLPGSLVSPAMAQQFYNGPGTSMDTDNGGLLPYQDMSGTPVATKAPRITIEVERVGTTLVKTPGLHGGGRMEVQANDAGGVMRALSSANAYFVRPNESSLGAVSGALMRADAWARADGQTEYPSLFSPYWQATLAPVSIGERSVAMATQISGGTQAGKP